MKGIRLYRCALKNYFLDPLFYITSLLTVLFCFFRFFYGTHFFVYGTGSNDLRPFFQGIPLISIITVPLLVFRIRRFIKDDSVPAEPFVRFLSLSFAALTAFMIPSVLLAACPLCVSFFCQVETGLVLASYAGILLYAFTAVNLILLIFSLKNINSASALFLSFAALSVLNFIHVLPESIELGSVLTYLMKKISFAWHFDSFSKGLIDLRTVVFFCCTSFIILIFCVFIEKKRTEQKINSKNMLLNLMSAVLIGFSFSNIYFKADLTDNRLYSVTPFTEKLISRIDQPLRITYYRSSQLAKLFPQASGISDYISQFADESSRITLSVKDADSAQMYQLGVYGQQIRRDTGSSTQFDTLYSAILLQYLDREEIIPFVLDVKNLEFLLAQKIQSLVFEVKPDVYLINGNGRELNGDYSRVFSWLDACGFEVHSVSEGSIIQTVERLTTQDVVIVSGTNCLSYEQCQEIKAASERGVNFIICTSPYTVDIDDGFLVRRSEGDSMIPVLNSMGFAFDDSLVNDIACFPMELTDAGRADGETIVRNYPLWINIMPQQHARQGLRVFWSTPIIPYKDVKPLVITSDYAWTVKEDKNSSIPFVTNPFYVSQSSDASPDKKGTFIVAAARPHMTVISDQYFLANFLDNEVLNLDFLCSQIFELLEKDELKTLYEKTSSPRVLYKITDPETFDETKSLTVFMCFVFIPALIIIMMITVRLRRKYKSGAAL